MAAAQHFTSGTNGKGERAMVMGLARLFGNRQWNRGFTLIELLIVILIVGILAAVATPLYLGYIKDAKTAEAKAVAGSLWTAVQSNAIASCGTPVTVASAYQKAGLAPVTGATNPPRWSVLAGGDVTVACADGAISPNQTVFTVQGVSAATDVSFIQVQLNYNSGTNPPSRLRCSTDSGATFVDC
jgi:prepilin-type N-terminal cleavage/methylation domain-containing protein